MNNLIPPFDNLDILRKYKSLKRELIKKEGLIKVKIFVASGSTTDEIIKILEIFLLNAGIKPIFLQGDFGLFYEDLAFKNNALEEFKPDVIYVHTSFKNLKFSPKLSSSTLEVEQSFKNELERFEDIWAFINNRYKCIIIQNNFDLPPHRSLGNLDSHHPKGKINYINKLNIKFAEYANSHENFFINDINFLSSLYGIENWFSSKEWYRSKHHPSLRHVPDLSYNISNIVAAAYGKTKKALVLDLDNTLWGGVIGDDGVAKIKIGNDAPVSEAYLDFQKYIKELHSRGVMLSIASKNDLKNALDGLNHPESEFKEKDFLSIKANWSDKAQNIQEISKELNILKDSLVFVDDNPAERELVKKYLPEVNVLKISSDVTEYIDILDRSGFFEVTTVSSDDMKRNSSLEANKERVKFEKKAINYEEYLTSLDMKSNIKESNGEELERITQLINKTNQFNLTTHRYTSSEVLKFIKSKDSCVIYGNLEDRFGENGITSVIVSNFLPKEIEIHIWVMSCRVFKREMEFAMFDKLVEIAKKKKKQTIKGIYIPSSKNKMVAEFYESLGFKRIESLKNEQNEIHYEIEVNNIKPLNKLIQIVNE